MDIATTFLPSLKEGFEHLSDAYGDVFVPMFGATVPNPDNFERGQEVYRMFGTKFGSVRVHKFAQEAMVPEGVEFLKVYPNIIHLSKASTSNGWENVPKTIGGLRRRLQSMAANMVEFLDTSQKINICGGRVEFTVDCQSWEKVRNIWDQEGTVFNNHLKCKNVLFLTSG